MSTSGTDSDFVVKVIDVFPADYPTPEWQGPAPEPANRVRMGGYQQLVRGEPFRGKFRNSFEAPVAFVPNQPDRIRFDLPDVAHTFRRGHRLMVQIQSSWFPLIGSQPAGVHRHPEGASRRLHHRHATGLSQPGARVGHHDSGRTALNRPRRRRVPATGRHRIGG